MIVTPWKFENLSDLADMCLGKMLDQNKNKGAYFPYLANTNVRWGHVELDSLREMKFEPKEFDRYGLEIGDIVMCEGGEPGRCAIWKGQTASMMIQKALHRIRVKEGVSSHFLYYALLNKGIQGHYEAYFTGAAIKHLTGESLAKIKVLIPPLPTQQKIAKILSAYDELIENNLKRIKLLEEMAQLTYEEWFVRMKFPGHEQAVIDSETGLPEGWGNNSFGSVFNINNGYAFKSGDYTNAGIAILRTRDYSQTKWINISQPIYISKRLSEKYKKYYVQEYDLMLIMVGASIGSYGVVLPKDKGVLQNQNQWAIRTNEGFENYMFFKVLMMEKLIHKLLLMKTGAARDFFRASFLKELDILIPAASIIDKFNHLIEPTFKSINNLHIQNQNLKEARDILLPRLMTGMIDVNTLDLPDDNIIVPTLQRGNADSDAPASRNAERSAMNSHGDRGNYEGEMSEL